MKYWHGTILSLLLVLTGWSEENHLQRAKFTDIVNDVNISSVDKKNVRAARVNDYFEVPEVVKTGPGSRAELQADDKTITRVGSNTIFSFDKDKRTINLESGSVLFHSPKGMGGGTIKTAAATAAVTGTTIIVGATSNGGFKLMVLEGSSRVTHPSGDSKRLKAGQMSFIIPGKNVLGPTIEFDLQRATQDSQLLHGFNTEVSSKDKIEDEVNKQLEAIKKGKMNRTDASIEDVLGTGPVLQLDPPRSPDIANSNNAGSKNSFPQFVSYLDSQTANLTLASATLSGNDIFNSSFAANGTYKGFKIDTKGSFAALGASSLTFPVVSYDLSRFSTLEAFAFVANGTMSFSGNADFYNAPKSLQFLNTGGGITFASGTLVFSSQSVSFEALNTISNAGTLTFSATSGNINNLSLISKNGNITLLNPTFNAGVTTLSGGTVTLTGLNVSNFTGAKVLRVLTDTGNWRYIGSGLITQQAGEFNMATPAGGAVNDRQGGPGTQVNDGVTTFTIYSDKR